MWRLLPATTAQDSTANLLRRQPDRGDRSIAAADRIHLDNIFVQPNVIGQAEGRIDSWQPGQDMVASPPNDSPAVPVASTQRTTPAGIPAHIGEILPGLALAAAIAGVGFALNRLPHMHAMSPLILSIILGMAVHNGLHTPLRCRPGVKFALRRVLRLAIILLGLQLTVAQVLAVGGAGLAIVVASLTATFLFTLWLGRRLGVDLKLAELIAAGTSICGASAVIAANTVTEGSDEDVAYAVACVTVFGSAAMLLYPALGGLLHLDARGFGLWAGASIHEIAQVVAAAFQSGTQAGELATIAKLSRVALLAPVVILLGLAARRGWGGGESRQTRAAAPFPWFVIGFIAMIGFNSLDLLPAADHAMAAPVTTFLLSVALAAMGLETDIRKLKAEGLRPLLLGAGAWLFIGGVSLLLVKLIGA
jgi:uncharacterized integral membrane protein (TIGR00698 family)